MQKIKKLLLIIIFASGALFAVQNFALAALDTGIGIDGQATALTATGLGQTDPRIVIANVVRVALGFLGVLAVLLIIYAGFIYMTAQGEVAKIDQAKKILIGAIIG
ncbi:MAG: hypothetical protein NT091_04300, partial [Candidatus Falkowbacteria bacterium]|nr:hypothetical protein [Candidatus Falkowbacteria bacterium]